MRASSPRGDSRQQNGPLEDHSGRTGCDAPRGHPWADPPADPDRPIGARQDRLEENESGIRTDPPARLVAHGDQAIAPGIERGLGLGHRCDLAQRSPAGGMDPSACIPELFRRPGVGAHDCYEIFPGLVEPILTNFVRLDPDGVGSDLEISQTPDGLIPGVLSRTIQDAQSVSPICGNH